MKNKQQLCHRDKHIEKIGQTVNVGVTCVSPQNLALMTICKFVNGCFDARQLMIELFQPIWNRIGPKRVANLDFQIAAAPTAGRGVVETDTEIVQILNDLCLAFLCADFIKMLNRPRPVSLTSSSRLLPF